MPPIPFSVVIPTYNEANRIPKTLERLANWHPVQFNPLQILIVDDGSTDSTREIVKDYIKKDPRLTLIEAAHGGEMHAIITGYYAAQYDCVGNLEADCAADPLDFERLIAYYPKADAITGSRILRGDLPPIKGKSVGRRILSASMSLLFRILFRCGIHDPQIGFKVYKKDVLLKVIPLLTATHDGIKCAELLVKAYGLGYTIQEVPVMYHHDLDSRLVPKYPLGVAWRACVALFKVWFKSGEQYRRGLFIKNPIRGVWLALLFGKLTKK